MEIIIMNDKNEAQNRLQSVFEIKHAAMIKRHKYYIDQLNSMRDKIINSENQNDNSN